MLRRFRQRPDPDDAPDFEPHQPLGAPMPWPDGRHVAANAGKHIFLWDLATGECSRVLETSAIHQPPMFRLACEPVLGRVLGSHKLREFALWDSTDWRRLQVFTGHGEPVRAAEVIAEDRVLSISGDGFALLWDAWTGELLRRFETSPLYALAQSPAHGLVAVGGGKGAITLLDGPTLEVRASFQLPMATARHAPLSEERQRQLGIVWNRPSNTIEALTWHPDGEHLICGSWDFIARMVHSHTGHVVREWHGHAHWVDSVAVDPRRGLLCTGSSDGTVRVWSLDSTECLAVHDVGHADLGGLCLIGDSLYVTVRSELVVIPLP
ncbi:WD40 repeat domain-containing protein [Myxococcus sp. CA040A]|uniref:WD40 repeat domain-containing protein n=1 Tax=Myxococcus sp. CA040A TaxID=2741738 RepID=UPI0020C5D11F|nr:transcriptional regulator [Myxococcus sp. CA040A]